MKIIILVFSFFVLSGCTTTDALRAGKSDSAKFDVEGKTYDQVWKSAIKAMSSQLTIVQKSKENGIIKAEKGVGMTTWGEVVGVFISPANIPAKKYTVEVQSYKRSKLQITGQDWRQTIVTAIKTDLGQ